MKDIRVVVCKNTPPVSSVVQDKIVSESEADAILFSLGVKLESSSMLSAFLSKNKGNRFCVEHEGREYAFSAVNENGAS